MCLGALASRQAGLWQLMHNMSVPFVSAIVPVFNAAKYLDQALESMLNQTFQDVEYILINDGSTDVSGEIIKSQGDPRIRYYEQENRGIARTLNRGIALASGKYLWRHDADDICQPDQLGKQVRFLEQHPDIALVGMQVAFMTERGKIAWDCRQPKNQWFENKTFKLVERNDFNPYSPVTHATVLMSTNVICEIGGYREVFKTSEDTDLWLRLIDTYQAAVLNDCTYFVRQNPVSITRRNSGTADFYRNLAFECYEERQLKGSDRLMRGEGAKDGKDRGDRGDPGDPGTGPGQDPGQDPGQGPGRKFRADLLNYQYKIALNAKDWKLVGEIFRVSVRDGWRLAKTWKALVFPWVSERFIHLGVKIKGALR